MNEMLAISTIARIGERKPMKRPRWVPDRPPMRSVTSAIKGSPSDGMAMGWLCVGGTVAIVP